jgi:hypothetical protein
MALRTESLSASAPAGKTFTQTAVVDNIDPSTTVFASCSLNSVKGVQNQTNPPQAEIFISGFVQNGSPAPPTTNQSLLILSGITSITVGLTVSSASAQGILTITTDV